MSVRNRSKAKTSVKAATLPDNDVERIIKIYVNVPTASFTTDLLFPCGVPAGGIVSVIVGDFSRLKETFHCEKIPLAPFVLKQKLVINTPNSDGKPLCIPKPCNPTRTLETFWKCLTPNESTVTLSAQHLMIKDASPRTEVSHGQKVDDKGSEKSLSCDPEKDDALSEDDAPEDDTQVDDDTEDEAEVDDPDGVEEEVGDDDDSPTSAARKRKAAEGPAEDSDGITIFKKKVRADAQLSDVSSGSDETEFSGDDCEGPEMPTQAKPTDPHAEPKENNFFCAFCDKGFPSRTLCQQHVWGHVPILERVYECSKCNSSFSTSYALERHLKTCHAEKVSHPCATCGKVFVTPRDLEKHSWVHSAKITVYCCEYCGWQFMLKAHYDLHIAHHHKSELEASDANVKAVQDGAEGLPGVEVFPCGLCSLVFQSEEQRDKHKEAKHEVKLITREERQFYVCPMCSKHISASFYIFNKHMATHRQPQQAPVHKFPCTVCGAQLATVGGLRGHMTIHSKTDPHPCTKCPRKFRTAFYLRKHIENVHATDLKHECRFCPRKFVDDKKLKLHLAVVHERLLNDDERLFISSLKVYPCDHCSFSTYSQKVIKNHVSGHTGVYPFHCSVCKKGYSYKYQMTQHMAMTHMSEGGKCDDCGRVFYHNASFERHQEMHALGVGFPCEHCKKVYESEGLRRRHVTDNHQVEPGVHKCDVCGKSFDLATSLRLHRRSAHETRMAKRPSRRFDAGLVCDTCGADFKFVGSLEAHKVVKHNTPEGRDIICPYCERKSSSQLALSLHMRIHFNEKPFKCKYCQRAFTLLTSCRVHQQRHERNKKFVCPHCECEFFFESKLNRHLMAFHSALYDEEVAISLGHVSQDDDDDQGCEEVVDAPQEVEIS